VFATVGLLHSWAARLDHILDSARLELHCRNAWLEPSTLLLPTLRSILSLASHCLSCTSITLSRLPTRWTIHEIRPFRQRSFVGTTSRLEAWAKESVLQKGERQTKKNLKKTGPGRMAETPCAGTGDFACRS